MGVMGSERRSVAANRAHGWWYVRHRGATSIPGSDCSPEPTATG